MHKRVMTRLLLAGSLLVAATACGDLTVEPKSTVTSANIFTDPASYRAFLAKLYGGLAITGQSGPDGNADIQGIDEGFSQYTRGYWQLQELPTDEAIIGWGDTGLPELNFQTWGATNPFVGAMYARIFYQVALANQFLRETSDDKLASRGVPADLQNTIHQYRAEARFLRALSYWHALDLFGNVPLVDENFDVSQLPTQATPQQVFDFVESELKDIRGQLPGPKQNEYGRADQGAVDMLLAHLYLNAEVYTGTPRYADAQAAAQSVIESGAYSLDPDFRRIFSADNNTSPEMIFAVPQDGVHTRTWGGMTYLVHGAVGGSMNAANYGIGGGWWGLRLRPETVDRYEGGANGPDGRTSFFWTDGQTEAISDYTNFNQGIGAPKYTNMTSTGQAGSNSDFPDTDYPMFRLADAYLIYAEAYARGAGGDGATALGYVNALRERAYGGPAGDVTLAWLTPQHILDERSRELMWEGFRRQDLIRFGQFTGSSYVWSWKGGVAAGEATDAHLALYPIPANELSANPNIKQNPGY